MAKGFGREEGGVHNLCRGTEVLLHVNKLDFLTRETCEREPSLGAAAVN